MATCDTSAFPAGRFGPRFNPCSIEYKRILAGADRYRMYVWLPTLGTTASRPGSLDEGCERLRYPGGQGGK